MLLNKNYAIIDYNFFGKIIYENKETINVSGSRWCKPKTHIKRINYLQFLLWKIADYTRGKIID